MKHIFFCLIAAIAVISCEKKDPNQSTEQADYAETHEKLIDNHIQDSIKADSVDASTAMPPQTKP